MDNILQQIHLQIGTRQQNRPCFWRNCQHTQGVENFFGQRCIQQQAKRICKTRQQLFRLGDIKSSGHDGESYWPHHALQISQNGSCYFAIYEYSRQGRYIAFGHYATPSAAEIEKVLVALIDFVEADTIDGFIWATMRVSDFPENVITSRGISMIVTNILHNSEKYPHYKFAKWAPQFSILAHPLTAFFMTPRRRQLHFWKLV